MSELPTDRFETDDFGARLLAAVPCPACGAHDWTAPVGGPGYCVTCNCQVKVRRGQSEGYVVVFNAATCWERQHRDAVPAVEMGNGETKRPVMAKFLSDQPGATPEWVSATAVTLGNVEPADLALGWDADEHFQNFRVPGEKADV